MKEINKSYKKYNIGDTQISSKNLYNDVCDKISELTTNKNTFKEIESWININYDNILVRLKEQIPNISDRHITLIIYDLCGLSTSIIALLMNDTANNIYQQRYRIKQKIADSDAADKDYFLRIINI